MSRLLLKTYPKIFHDEVPPSFLFKLVGGHHRMLQDLYRSLNNTFQNSVFFYMFVCLSNICLSVCRVGVKPSMPTLCTIQLTIATVSFTTMVWHFQWNELKTCSLSMWGCLVIFNTRLLYFLHTEETQIILPSD